MDGQQREKMLLAVAFVCILALVGDRLIFTPLIGFWDSRSEEITTLKQDLSKGDLLIDRERTIRRRWREMQRDALPVDVSRAGNMVVVAEDRWVNASRIKKISFRSQWKSYRDENYQTLECRAVYQGTMAQIARFLFEMENDPLPMKVDLLEISSPNNDGQLLTLTLTLSGVQFIPEDETS